MATKNAKEQRNAAKNGGKSLSEVIAQRERLIKIIHSDMDKIRIWNEVKIGTVRDFDVMQLYNTIIKNEKELIKVKLAIQFANCGITALNNDLLKNSNYPLIFELNLLTERLTFLSFPKGNSKYISTRNDEGYSSTLSAAFIADEKTKLSARRQEIQNKLSLFNDNTYIIVDYDDLPF